MANETKLVPCECGHEMVEIPAEINIDHENIAVYGTECCNPLQLPPTMGKFIVQTDAFAIIEVPLPRKSRQ